MTPEQRFKDAGINGKEFRGAPFWSWNDDLDPEELRRQIREMRAAGMGGFFMHTRTGLVTPYLSEEYMKCHEACIDEARKLGMGAWLYDEDCWPSGFAGGIVPGRGLEYQSKSLTATEIKTGEPRDGVVALFAVRREDDTLIDANPVTNAGDPNKEYLGFQLKHHGYVDVLKSEAIGIFIESTYDLFAKQFKRDFGGVIPGIFTDEPSYFTDSGTMSIPWTEALPQEFQARWGYDLMPHIPSLLFELGDWQRIRHDFYRTLTELYVEAFSKQIGEWCQKHGLAFTGHQLFEETLELQTGAIGAAMPHYEYMQVPGVDMIMRALRDPVYMKQVSSAAHQFGRSRVLCECFGCGGWNESFEDQKWLGEWQYALGVNMNCQHLMLYSLRGCRKRDYPPSIFYQQPWWREYNAFEDHFARLGAALTSGKYVADVLVIHPIESEWCVYHPKGLWLSDEYNQGLIKVSDSLNEIQVGWDYGDESILERYGSAGKGRLKVGEAEYKVVIIPPALTLRKSTLRLLTEFVPMNNVIIVGQLPTRQDGVSSRQPENCLDDCPFVPVEKEAIKKAVLSALSPRISVTDRDGNPAAKLFAHERDLGGKRLFFLANSDRENGIETQVSVPGKGLVEEWDLDTGDIRPVLVNVEHGTTIAEFDFAPTGSHLFSFDPAKEPIIGEPERWRMVEEKEINGPWKIDRKDPNAITLDYCRYKIADDDWSEPTHTIWLQDKLADVAEETPLTMQFTFNVDFEEWKPRDINLILEIPEKHEITINGQRIEYQECGWWTDVSFKKIPIDHLVKPGENVIELRRSYLGAKEVQRRLNSIDLGYMGRAYTNPPPDAVDPITLPFSGDYAEIRRRYNELKYGYELESIYLIGDFNVKRDGSGFVLTDATQSVEIGDLVEQGYPFHRGSVVYSTTVDIEKCPEENIILTFDRIGAIVTKVRVNGKDAGRIVWQPYEMDVTDFVVNGVNTIEIETINSCRNLLGPHHSTEADPIAVGARNFKGQRCYGGIKHENGRMFWRLDGIEPEVGWTDDYSFAEFGLVTPPKILHIIRQS